MLKESEIPADDVLFNELQVKYNQQFNLSWVGLYGFNNTYGLAVRKDLADKYNINTYSDLAKYAKEFSFGAECDFYERDDGFDPLCKEYDMEFKIL